MPTFEIRDTLWSYPGPAGWFFVAAGADLRSFLQQRDDIRRTGWGYVPVSARVGATTWQTTLFPDKKHGYLLAIKADVRSKEDLHEGDQVTVVITVD